MRSHETPSTESDKHCDQNKANVWAGAAVVILKAKILVNSSVYRFRNKRNGRHQTLLLGWVQNRLKISRKMAGITKRVGEIGAKSIHTFPETGERPRKVQALVSGMFTGILYEKNVNKNKVKTFKRWQAAYLHRRETFETFYILLHWGDLFQGSYSLKFELWYRFYIADQDTARYSLCSARENCVSWAEPLKCSTDNLFSSRVFLLNL